MDVGDSGVEVINAQDIVSNNSSSNEDKFYVRSVRNFSKINPIFPRTNKFI